MKLKHQRNILAAAIACAVAAPAVQAADLYYQPFNISAPPNTCDITQFPAGPGNYPFPVDWLLFNVDGRTPAGGVAYINNAWIVREHFLQDATQCIAFSTSWYTPAGVADDWMWSPAVAVPAGGASLGWRAMAYDPGYRDGYQVRVKTGDAPTQENQTTSDVVFATSAEDAAWTQRTFDLAAYAGQAVYIGFRNNSNDKFLLVVDDVRVQGSSDSDLAATAPIPPFTSEYARAPIGMEFVPSLAVTATNVGGSALTNITAIAVPTLDGSAAGPSVSSNAPVASLAIGASAPLTFGAPATCSGAGTWTTKYTLFSNQTAFDLNPVNDSIEVPGTTIGGNELARWEGAATGVLGIGAGNGGEIGVQLTIPVDGWYGGAHFGIQATPPDDGMGSANICPGFDYVVNLRAFDTANNVPGELVASTEPVACEYDVAYSVDAPFAGGALFLTAGTYVVTAVEPVAGPTLRVLLHDNRFVENAVWVNWPTNPFGGWANVEDFGVGGFLKSPELSLLTGGESPIFADGFDGAAPRPAALRRTDHVQAPLSPRLLRKPAPTRIAVSSDR